MRSSATCGHESLGSDRCRRDRHPFRRRSQPQATGQTRMPIPSHRRRMELFKPTGSKIPSALARPHEPSRFGGLAPPLSKRATANSSKFQHTQRRATPLRVPGVRTVRTQLGRRHQLIRALRARRPAGVRNGGAGVFANSVAMSCQRAELYSSTLVLACLTRMPQTERFTRPDSGVQPSLPDKTPQGSQADWSELWSRFLPVCLLCPRLRQRRRRQLARVSRDDGGHPCPPSGANAAQLSRQNACLSASAQVQRALCWYEMYSGRG